MPDLSLYTQQLYNVLLAQKGSWLGESKDVYICIDVYIYIYTHTHLHTHTQTHMQQWKNGTGKII